MTHDELLARIDEDEKFLETYFGGKFKGQSALRAVVELHKPKPEYYPNTDKGIDAGYGFKLACRTCMTLYPCQTIRAIDKLLK